MRRGSPEFGALAGRLRAYCRPLVRGGWRPLGHNMADADLFATSFGAEGRGVPASLTRGQLVLEVAVLEDGTLRIAAPLDEQAALSTTWINAVRETATLDAAGLAEPGQPQRFYERNGLLP